MKMLFTILLIPILVFLSGCSATVSTHVISSPISASRAQLVNDGQTTRTDIVTMFGNPNGFIQGMPMYGGYDPRSPYMNQKTKIMHYKDCVTGADSGRYSFGMFTSSGTARIKCKVFTALLNNKDIVVAHAFIEDNYITKDKLSVIIPKKSSRKNVIRQLGGPSSMVKNGNDEIYLYKDCIVQSKRGGIFSPGMNALSVDNNCQQTSIVLNKKTGMVKKVNFFPYLESK